MMVIIQFYRTSSTQKVSLIILHNHLKRLFDEFERSVREIQTHSGRKAN